MDLQQFFTENPRAALAFSGGTDSAYLLYAAKQCGAQVQAYYVKTPFQPDFELSDARRLADELNMPLTVLELDVLEDERIRSNPKNRCYYCKKRLFSAIFATASADGFQLVLDGTNASDDAADRPGMQALQELKVLSPLRLCGLTKADVRALSKEAGLFTHDKPAYACLATRIPAGTPITYEALVRTQWAEEYLKSLGFSDFRVRVRQDCAKLEVTRSQLPLLQELWAPITAQLKTQYADVLTDVEVRNESGN